MVWCQVRLTCRVAGRPDPEIFWYKAGQLITQDTRHKVIASHTNISDKENDFSRPIKISNYCNENLKTVRKPRYLMLLHYKANRDISNLLNHLVREIGLFTLHNCCVLYSLDIFKVNWSRKVVFPFHIFLIFTVYLCNWKV